MTDKKLTPQAIRSDISRLIVPIILESILSMLANVISMAMLGRLDLFGVSTSLAISARGISSQITNIVWFTFKGVSVGGTILIAQAFGRDDQRLIGRLGRALVKSLLASAVVAGVLLFLTARPLLQLIFNPGAEILDLASRNLRILAMGFPALAIMLSVTGIFQGKGDTRTPLILTAIYNSFNILLGFPLILGLPFGTVGGVIGNGIALVSAQYLTALGGAYLLFRRNGALSGGETEGFKPFLALAKRLWALGLPTSFESLFWQTAAIILSRVLLSYGEIAYSANQLGLQAEQIVDMPAIGFGIASTTLIGRLIGANKKSLGVDYFRELRKMAIALMTVGSLILILLPEPIMRLLTTNQEVIELGKQYLRIMGFIQIPQNLQRIYTGSLKGAGITIWPMLVAGIGLWGIRLPLSLAIWRFTDFAVVALWFVVAIDQVVRFILSVVVFRRYDIFERGS